MKRNTCIKDENGKEYYSGRYGVAVGIVFAKINNELYILANKRGKGAPSHQGEWNLPVGFIEYGESGEQAAAREVYEETTIIVRPDDFKFVSVWCPANANTIALRYEVLLYHLAPVQFKLLNHTGGEPDEVAEVKWINVKDLDDYVWCYQHERLIHLESLKIK